jgi:hypothetical protein
MAAYLAMHCDKVTPAVSQAETRPPLFRLQISHLEPRGGPAGGGEMTRPFQFPWALAASCFTVAWKLA